MTRDDARALNVTKVRGEKEEAKDRMGTNVARRPG